jgi:hypothetical protein
MWVEVRAPETLVKMMFPAESIVFAWQETQSVRVTPVGCPENCGGMP